MGYQGITGGPQHISITRAAMEEVAKDQQQELKAEQRTSSMAFMASVERGVNTMATKTRRKSKDLKTLKTRVQKMKESAEKGKRFLPVERIKNSADNFQQRNPELKSKVLTLLREHIKPDDSIEDILNKIADFYPDVSLADEALEFLLETTEGELHQKVEQAKAQFNKTHGREIAAGRNVNAQAQQASEKGLGAPTTLRNLYRDMTGNPRDSNTLFQELSQRYAFKDLAKVVKFLMHALGADMKAKGPSIPRGQLHVLLQETRSLQAIMGVYKFFRNRMVLVNKLFQRSGLDIPQQLTFEVMSKQFMSLAGERYPSADKVMQLSSKMGIEKWILAKIIVLSQLRDAVREVAVNQIYKSLQHRDEMYLAILEALEDLEDELEKEEEREIEEEERERERQEELELNDTEEED